MPSGTYIPTAQQINKEGEIHIPFWNIGTLDGGNMKRVAIDVDVAHGTNVHNFKVPTLVNTKVVRPGDLIALHVAKRGEKRKK